MNDEVSAHKIYFISGLAADEKAFRHIVLPGGFSAIYINWIPPKKSEPLQAYAMRMAEKIDPTSKFSLVGLSMGGMVAAEIARKYHPGHLILISSIPSPQHLPVYYKWARVLRLHRIVPVSALKRATRFKRLFTAETAEDKEMLRRMVDNSDDSFIDWAIGAILSWNTKELPGNYYQIHGSRDAILPRRFTKPTHIIQGAGHLMILNRADEINQILEKILKN